MKTYINLTSVYLLIINRTVNYPPCVTWQDTSTVHESCIIAPSWSCPIHAVFAVVATVTQPCGFICPGELAILPPGARFALRQRSQPSVVVIRAQWTWLPVDARPIWAIVTLWAGQHQVTLGAEP